MEKDFFNLYIRRVNNTSLHTITLRRDFPPTLIVSEDDSRKRPCVTEEDELLYGDLYPFNIMNFGS